MSSGHMITQRRRCIGLTQETLAEKINVSRQTIAMWETSKQFPGDNVAILAARFLDIPEQELLEQLRWDRLHQRVDRLEKKYNATITVKPGEIFTQININQPVEQVIELTQQKDQARANGITICIETDLPEVPPVMGNESDLCQVLLNLILNAVDAMPKGGTIIIRTRHDNKHVILEVSDTGVGMTEEVQQRCFEPFFSTRGKRGTGLGLAVVHDIIRRHEGTINIKSELDKGTTFIIRLPVTTRQQDKEKT